MDPEGVERRLAAILHADVVGYSRLMAEHQDSTVRLLGAYRDEIELLIGQHGGRLVDFTGDDLLVEFGSAVQAVRCALEIQSVLRARNARVPDGRRLEFRMGAHVGEVRVEGERLYGTGVNVAARLQALADPGGLCISSRIHAEVRGHLELVCDDLGEQQLRNIPEAVRVLRVRLDGTPARTASAGARRPVALAVSLLVVTAAALGAWRLLAPSTPPSEREVAAGAPLGAPALAVLPFNNLSGDPEQEYFADGLAEDLITRLSEVLAHGEAVAVGVPVIARNSSFVYKGQSVNVQDVSRELGARYVVEGSVRRSADRLRVSVQLIDGPTGHHVWAETYDRELHDIFEIQDQITEAVAHAVGFQLGRAEMERAMSSSSRNLDAWETAHKAAWYFQRMTPEDMTRSRELFTRVTELDPRWVWPYQALVMTHVFEIGNQWTDSPRDSILAAMRTARTAAALDDLDPYGHLAMGSAYQLTGELTQAVASFQRALELSPNMALAHLFLMRPLAGRDPAAALAHFRRFVELSPRDPYMQQALAIAGLAHFSAGRYAEALDAADRSLTLRRDDSATHRVRAAALVKLGRLPEAQAELALALRLQPSYTESVARAQTPEAYVDALLEAGLPAAPDAPAE
jgi:adenylate cyclase